MQNPYSKHLYDKMYHVHSLMTLLRGDKARKKSAQEDLWKAQSGETYWEGLIGGIRRPEARISAYKALIEAEKATRIHGSFSPGIIMDDIDCDGEKEVLYQASDMNCYIHEKGAAVFELDSFRNKHNYCCVYDLDEKRYPGCFIDRIFAANNFDKELHDLSTQLYSANERDQSPQKIIFSKDFAIREGTAHHSFTLKKSYFFQKYCISVDIEIINRSQCQVPLRYCSEVNIQPSANYEDVEYYAVDVREKQKIPAQLKPPLISAEAIIAQTIQGKELLEIRSDKLFQMQMEHFLDRLDTPQIIKLYDGPMGSDPSKAKGEVLYQGTKLLFGWDVDMPARNLRQGSPYRFIFEAEAFTQLAVTCVFLLQ